MPEFAQDPKVAEGRGGVKLTGGQVQRGGIAVGKLQQAAQDNIEVAADLLQASQGGDGALLDLSGLVAKGLDQLDVLPGS